MLKYLTIVPLSLIMTLMMSSFSALADFDYPGNGTLVYPTGMQKPFNFGFAFKQGPNGYFFKVGKQEMSTSDVPSKYSIWLTLHQDKHIFVQEFAKGYFQEFDWNLGDHNIKLSKKEFKDKDVKGNYVLTIDGKTYQFSKKSAEISINFTKKGIRSIDTSGFIKLSN
ncbi:MAG: hypothetical protein ACI8WB_004605 [Phenylobacterium sp.]|jgi:hypothetical protein